MKINTIHNHTYEDLLEWHVAWVAESSRALYVCHRIHMIQSITPITNLDIRGILAGIAFHVLCTKAANMVSEKSNIVHCKAVTGIK